MESENFSQFSDRTASDLPALGHNSPREGGRDAKNPTIPRPELEPPLKLDRNSHKCSYASVHSNAIVRCRSEESEALSHEFVYTEIWHRKLERRIRAQVCTAWILYKASSQRAMQRHATLPPNDTNLRLHFRKFEKTQKHASGSLVRHICISLR